jgi:DNA helicase-2/ATP-dependent DNA helicase PcrA
MQEAKVRIPKNARSGVEINTYHGFAWSFIQTHGYLLTGHRMLRLLPPPDAASKLAGIAAGERAAALKTLLVNDGLIGFEPLRDFRRLQLLRKWEP